MVAPLYRRHSPGLAATYADVENHVLSQGEIMVGTPGSVTLRSNGTGSRFWVRQYYDFERRKRDQYIVGYDSPDAERRLSELKQRIAEAKDLLKSVRMLAREGYSTLTPRHFAALAPLADHGFFRAGGLLVGTHAFEVIVNRLGIRAESFATEDVDLARASQLAVKPMPEGGLLALLRESGIDFVEVPQFDHGKPSTSFKERGRSRFTVDLLVPATGDKAGAQAVPELQAHAAALPFLRYLLSETQTGAALSTQGIAAVRVPVPERFALHKLIVSRLRVGRSEKSLKDLRQAAVLIAAVGELHPGALEDAYKHTPLSMRSNVRRSLEKLRDPLAAHPRAWEEVSSFAKLA
jgi:hypothetical protein